MKLKSAFPREAVFLVTRTLTVDSTRIIDSLSWIFHAQLSIALNIKLDERCEYWLGLSGRGGIVC